ncbi:MAG: hypothetical protein ABS44_11250 [Chryseobacterium sp. SCN 40-13]|nr:MAG: hypothetical protein ABS44_11250 [Chryseobacterium sp. SCN 40-13]
MIKFSLALGLFLFSFSHGFSQQIHVKYLHVRSAIATLYEDLYVKDNSVVSIQDSLINFNTFGTTSAIKKSNKPITKNYFISKINEKESRAFFFTGRIEDDEYFIYDEVPASQWITDESSTKKILGYECFKATTNFRGSKFVAYFTKELPYSTGPFKFYGLPGLILDIREENKNYNIWKADKIEINSKKEINYDPVFNDKTKVIMRKFIEAKENKYKIENSNLLNHLPPETKIETNNRLGIEKKYEWE